MSRQIGTSARLNGKQVRWAGDKYGWQSPASFSKLEQSNEFKVGGSLLNELSRYLGPAISNIRGFQDKVKEATPWLDPVEDVVNRGVVADDRLPSSRVAQGTAITAQRVGDALNVDPRLGIAAGLLIGGVKQGDDGGFLARLRSGPKKPKFNSEASSIDRIRYGPSGKPAPKPVLESTPKPKVSTPVPEVRRQLVEDYGVPKVAADDLLRYQPQKTPKGKTISREEKVALINPDLEDLKSKTKEFYSASSVTDRKGVEYKPKQDRPYTVPLSDKEVTVIKPDGTKNVLKIEGAKTIQERVRKIPGMEDVVIDSMQAHHRFVLKESTDFMQYFDDPKIVRDAYKAAGINPGDDVMQRIDLPVRLHQTDPSIKYDGYKANAAHERLQARPGTPEHAAKTPIQAEPGMSRWGHLMDLPNDKARMKYIKQHIEDLRKSEKIGLESYFQQFLIQPGREQYGVDPYIGNFGQQVLAPHNPIGDIIRQSYVNRRRMKINGP